LEEQGRGRWVRRDGERKAVDGCERERMDPVAQLEELLKEKQRLYQIRTMVPISIGLVDAEIMRLQSSLRGTNAMSAANGGHSDLFSYPGSGSPYLENPGRLLKSHGPSVKKRLKLPIPAEKYPEYNFVGRLLGPRGATLKTMEKDTGCRIMIRGKGSIRKEKESDVRGKPGYEHIFNEPLHVVIEADMDEVSAVRAISRAKEEIEQLLVPVPEERDMLKKQQLKDLAMMSGNLRGIAGSVPNLNPYARYHEMREPGPTPSSGPGAYPTSPADLYDEGHLAIEDVSFEENVRERFSSPRSKDLSNFSFHDMESAVSDPEAKSGRLGMRTSEGIAIVRNKPGAVGSGWEGGGYPTAAKSVPHNVQHGSSPLQWGSSFAGLGGVWSPSQQPFRSSTPTRQSSSAMANYNVTAGPRPGTSHQQQTQRTQGNGNANGEIGDLSFGLEM